MDTYSGLTKAAVAAACAVLATAVQAQPTPAQIQQQQFQQQQNMQGAYQADQRAMQQRNANAAAQREANARWWAEERRILANIEKHKATPYYGTLIIQNSNNLGWGGGGNISKELAVKKAMRVCDGPTCEVLITFSNSCAAATRPAQSRNSKDWIVFTDPNPKTAIEKSFDACEAKHGKHSCIMAINNKNEKYSYTQCSGYEYESYDQK